MNEIKNVLDKYLMACKEKGYTVIREDKDIIVYNVKEAVTLEVQLENGKMNINFYKNVEASTDFVNELMQLFADVVNGLAVV